MRMLRTDMGQIIAFIIVMIMIIIIAIFTFRRQLEDAFNSILNCERPFQCLQCREKGSLQCIACLIQL